MSDRTNKKLERAFNKALATELKKLGNQTLDKSRELVPVDSGNLRDSSKILHVKKGWTITYDTPYASDMEAGRSDVKPDYTMNIKRHKRRLASGKVTTVTSHTKQYHNYQRPKQLSDGEWRILSQGNIEGSHFLTYAWTAVRKGIKDKSLRNALPVRLSTKTLDKSVQ